MNYLVVDLGCGTKKVEGSFGFDLRSINGVDVVCDLEKPMPIKNNSVNEVHTSHTIEHIKELIQFMEEVFRICKPGGQVIIVAPYYSSRGAFRDPTHVRFITEDTFQYFEPPTDYDIRTNFLIEKIEYDYRKPFRYFPRYFQKRFRRYFLNIVDNMVVTLRVIKS